MDKMSEVPQSSLEATQQVFGKTQKIEVPVALPAEGIPQHILDLPVIPDNETDSSIAVTKPIDIQLNRPEDTEESVQLWMKNLAQEGDRHE